MQNNRFYVYCFINKDWNNSVFYVGKGTGNRYNNFKDRNKHIKAILENHNCESKILFRDLTEEDALRKEKHLKDTFKMIGYPIIDGEASATHAIAQRNGIQKAVSNGVKFGRTPASYPDNWEQVMSLWKCGEITATKAMELTHTKRTTFYKLVKRNECSNN